MMGFFSIYTGLIYNDIFSKSFNIFGSHWAFREDIFANGTQNVSLGRTIMLDPGNFSQYKGDPYVFGVDPAWQAASNKIIFLNGYKMKISLIFGLIHMVFGVTLSAWQKVLKRKYAEIFVEFIPQLVFLVSIFCYLIFLIFFKWVSYEANVNLHGDPTNDHSEHCAPNLLITFINMMLFKGDGDADPTLVKLCHGYETYMFRGQGTLQKFLVIMGVLMVPIMLFGKPILFILNRRRMAQRPATDGERLLGDAGEDVISQQGSNDGGEHADDNLGEVFIYQGIHTIEYVLGSVSHTASYLRLWALSLAHSQLSEVLWNMVLKNAFTTNYLGVILLYAIFSAWAFLTLAILVLMEGLSAFLHTLRLHWVEFQSKFYEGQGTLFHPFSFDKILKENAESEGSSAA
jgi:V-type H+-transporting ATPase subunit a